VTVTTGRSRPGAFVARPTDLDGALAALGEAPDAQLLAGGTDFCVEVNFGHRRPSGVICLRRVRELSGCRIEPDTVTVGAGTTYTGLIHELAGTAPALAAAARTVGSPQIRNAGTIGGNVATASPAGDALPFLAAAEAEVVLRSEAGERVVPLGQFITGVKRTDRRPGEMITEVRFTRTNGPQQFLKVGTRNAMVIAIASAAIIVDTDRRVVRCGLGSVGPVPIRALEAEELISGAIDWDRLSAPDSAVVEFGQLAGRAAAPITDHRSTADYRRRAIEVVAERGLRRCLAHVG
jgi:CO/xanthine dehydrogenase FAD-binding subunit